MQKKLNIFQFLTLFAYIWVIATLPLHSHNSSKNKDNHEYCTHSQSDKHHQHSSQEEEKDCVICINLHTPAAINDIEIFETSVIAIDYYPSYNVNSAIIDYDHYTAQTSNKDPPLSIIS